MAVVSYGASYPIHTPARCLGRRYIQCGPALFVIEVWYRVSIGLLRGFMRLWFLLVWHLSGSFFYPHACVFPDGFESWDSAHEATRVSLRQKRAQDAAQPVACGAQQSRRRVLSTSAEASRSITGSRRGRVADLAPDKGGWWEKSAALNQGNLVLPEGPKSLSGGDAVKAAGHAASSAGKAVVKVAGKAVAPALQAAQGASSQVRAAAAGGASSSREVSSRQEV